MAQHFVWWWLSSGTEKNQDCLQICLSNNLSTRSLERVDRLFERQICSSQIELPVFVAIVTHVLKMNFIKIMNENCYYNDIIKTLKQVFAYRIAGLFRWLNFRF